MSMNPSAPVESAPLPVPLPPPRLSARAGWGSRQPISFLMQQAVENQGVLSLAAGLVDPATLPVTEVQEIAAELLAHPARARHALQYGTTQGSEPLRQEVLALFARREGVSVEQLGLAARRVILTTGSQQLLSLVAEVLLDPGDIVLVAAPTYFAFLGTLNGVGAKTIPVETDDQGMRMEALEAALSQCASAGELDRVKLIYLVSDFENPSGISLSADRRREVVEIARRWSRTQQITILEDAAYRELRYDGVAPPSVWSQSPGGEGIIYAGTFSKSFSPGLRVGFGIVPEELVGPLCDKKGNEDFGSTHFSQHLLTRVLQRGRYESHVEQVRAGYRAKRNAMLAAADEFFSDIPGVEWVRPEGGLYVWMSLPPSIETGFESALFARAAKVEQVMYVPGEVCYGGPPETRPKNQMRLSFGVLDAEALREGMRRLAAAVRATLAGSP